MLLLGLLICVFSCSDGGRSSSDFEADKREADSDESGDGFKFPAPEAKDKGVPSPDMKRQGEKETPPAKPPGVRDAPEGPGDDGSDDGNPEKEPPQNPGKKKTPSPPKGPNEEEVPTPPDEPDRDSNTPPLRESEEGSNPPPDGPIQDRVIPPPVFRNPPGLRDDRGEPPSFPHGKERYGDPRNREQPPSPQDDPVPEPSTIVLVVSGAACLSLYMRKRRKKAL